MVHILSMALILSSLIVSYGLGNRLPLIFHKDYDISFFGIEKLHPFDSKKYGKVFNYLLRQNYLSKESFYEPAPLAENDLLLVHTPAYLNSLNSSSVAARIAEIGILSWLPNWLVRRCLLNPMKRATSGTILGAELALKYGWSINLSGGYHHAKKDSGGGFCFYADIPLAIIKIFEKNPTFKVMIIDLDAHQGNGHESIFKDEPRVSIFDVYNKDIYPHDIEARKRINFNFPVNSHMKDSDYLRLLAHELPKAIVQVKPNLIIYNAGTDIFEEDPLGHMNISAKGIIQRDELVFSAALNRKIPILMVLSGGYTSKSAEIVGRSIDNLLTKVIPQNS